MGILNAAIQGAAEIAVPALVSRHQINEKGKILAARDKMLQSFQTSERFASQDFRVSERLSGQKAEAGESKLERESREKIAETRAGTTGTRYKVVGGRLFDTVNNKVVDLPENVTKLKELATKIAIAHHKEQKSYDKEKKTLKELTTDAFTMLSDLGDQPDGGDDGGDPGGGRSAVFTHSVLGDIFEDDITKTMKLHSLSRQQVLDRMGK